MQTDTKVSWTFTVASCILTSRLDAPVESELRSVDGGLCGPGDAFVMFDELPAIMGDRCQHMVFLLRPRVKGFQRLAAIQTRQRRHTPEESMIVNRLLVAVVDDDESVRESLPDLLREFGFVVRTFFSAEDFLASDCVDQTKCLILDIAMPGMSGFELQRELKLRRHEIPIIFITANRDESVRASALEQGAVEYLFKPFSDTALLAALNAVPGGL